MLQQYSHSFWTKSLNTWLAFGFLWFLAGIAWAPDSKVYRQCLVVFLWLPTLTGLVMHYKVFYRIFLCNQRIAALFVLLLCWAGISTSWSNTADVGAQVRRLAYVFLFLCSTFYLSYGKSSHHPVRLMHAAVYALALAAFSSLVVRYGIEGQPLSTRLSGIGTIDHPILGGYVIGMALLWLSTNLPQQWLARAAGACAILAMFVFVLLTQSRGLWLALIGTSIAYAFLGNRKQWLIAGGLLLCAVIGYWLFGDYVLARGTSYRPEIFEASLRMIASRPWSGLGLGSDYQVFTGAHSFPHSHNVFTHVAIELGLLGLILWVAIWGFSFKIAWCYRRRAEGEALLKILIFSSIAMLFDGSSLLRSPEPEWFISWLPVALAISLPRYFAQTQERHAYLG